MLQVTPLALIAVLLSASSATAGTAARAVVGPAAAAHATEQGVVDVTTIVGYQGGSAAGTGMVLSASGVVLTNNHVIRGATAIRVTDPATGRTYPATVVGYAVSSDVAVLKLKGATGLTPIAVGNSSTVKIGDSVTAVGNAGGVGGAPSSSEGSITALNRSIVAVDGEGSSEVLSGMIETNAQLQPGDSGGALLNAAGQVIGMNTAASNSYDVRAGASVGLAIPLNRAISIARQIQSGRPSATIHIGATALLGVSVTSQVDYYGQPVAGGGALVIGVVPSSPADKAGIAVGSVIMSLNGRRIVSHQSLSNLLLREVPGGLVRLAWVDQDGTSRTASVRTVSGPPQ